MKLSEEIIEAMNDIDEAFLEGSEGVLEKESIWHKKSWLALTAVVICLVVGLPLIAQTFSMGGSNSSDYKEEASTEVTEEAVIPEEGVEEDVLIEASIMYDEELVEYARGSRDKTSKVNIYVTELNGKGLNNESLKEFADELIVEGRESIKLISIEEGYIVVEMDNELIINGDELGDYPYEIYLELAK